MRPGTEVEISSVVEKTRKRWVLAFEKKKKKKKIFFVLFLFLFWNVPHGAGN